MAKAAIIGTTTWGTTLGVILAGKGTQVKLWARTGEEARELNRARQNTVFLPTVTFPQRLSATNSVGGALRGASLVILAVPAQTMRKNVRLVTDCLEPSMLILSAAKGLEVDTCQRMSQVIADEIAPGLHANICVLSGPNLAREVVQGLPAVTVVAAKDPAVAERARRLLSAPNFSLLTTTDVPGVELGGGLKNIIALGAGMADGLGYGDNAKAAFMTRGLAEIAALGVACGATTDTFFGLAGMGDLVVTCASHLSRNHYVGVELAKGTPLSEITASMRSVAEGVLTTAAARKMARSLGVKMPITEQIYRVLYEGLDPRQAVAELMVHLEGWDIRP